MLNSYAVVHNLIQRQYKEFKHCHKVRVKSINNMTIESKCLGDIVNPYFPIIIHVHISDLHQLIEYVVELNDIKERVDYRVVTILMSAQHYTNEQIKTMFSYAPKPQFRVNLN